MTTAGARPVRPCDGRSVRRVLDTGGPRAAARVLESGWVTSGPEVRRSSRSSSCGRRRHAGPCVLRVVELAFPVPAPAPRREGPRPHPHVLRCGPGDPARSAQAGAGRRRRVTGIPTEDSVARKPACDGARACSSCTGPAIPATSRRSPRPQALPSTASWRTRPCPRRRAGGRSRDQVPQPRCLGFYATKNFPSARAGWSPRRTGSGRLDARARLHGMTGRLAPLPAGRRMAIRVTEEGLKANLTDLQAAIGGPGRRRQRGARRAHWEGTSPTPLPHRDQHAWRL